MSADSSTAARVSPEPWGPLPSTAPTSWLRRALRRLCRNRSASFTAEGIRFILFTLAVGVAAINTGNNLFYLLVAMMLSLIILSGALSELSLRHLHLSVHAPEWMYVQTRAVVTLMLSNRRRHFPSFSLRLTDVVRGRAGTHEAQIQHLPAGDTIMFTYPLQGASRGRYEVEGFQLTTPFPFGLFLKSLFLSHPFTILVLPRPEPLPSALLAGPLAAGSDRSVPRKGAGMELYNLRLYQPGDDSRLIHWMSTARTSQLMVRETEADTHRRVTIRLSTTVPAGMTDHFERAVTLAASLVGHFHAQGYQLRVTVEDQEVRSAHDGDDLPRLLTPLALCQPRVTEVGSSEPGASRSRADWEERDDLLIAVLPWSSPDVRAEFVDATHVIDLTDHTPDVASDPGVELTPRIPR